MITSFIRATGSYIPETIVPNKNFLEAEFFEKDNTHVVKSNQVVIQKFEEITGIQERRYANPEHNASDLGFMAAKDALDSSEIDPETIDRIIVAHNFGDISLNSNRIDILPTLASRIKQRLQIHNPNCVAYDLPFGCPGWVEGLIQADYFIRSGDVKRCLVIGTETLSRILDPHDRDSMIYSDGAGAVIVEASTSGLGVLAHKTQTHAIDHAMLLHMGASFSADYNRTEDRFIKMNGRRVYEFALSQVPLVVKDVLDKAKVCVSEVNKILIHQANNKMDEAIVERLFKLFGKEVSLTECMPMTISKFGNSSVATIPTLLDLILKGKFHNHVINPGDKVVFASVGAGMNINAVLHQF
jgi:3-oxoacyl-[acyl-carrier-protein] synthase III